MKVEEAVLGSTPLIVLMVSVDVRQHCSISELRSCVKVEVAVLGSLSLIVLMVHVDVKLEFNLNPLLPDVRLLGPAVVYCGRRI